MLNLKRILNDYKTRKRCKKLVNHWFNCVNGRENDKIKRLIVVLR